jgi:hypothetical protein
VGKLQEVIQGVISMIVKKGRGTYVYSTKRVNGKPVTKYIGKSTSPQAKTYEKGKEKKKQQRNREEELQQLTQELESALKVIKITERAYLLLAGFYTRKSELRPLQKEHYAS